MQWSQIQIGSNTPEVRVNVASQAELLKDLGNRLKQTRGFQLATLNLDHVVKLHHSRDFAAAYARHSHVTADGRPIVWLNRLAGQDVDLVTGSDLVLPLAQLTAQTETSVAFFGSSESSLAGAGDALQALCPNLRITAKIAPPMGFDPTSAEADKYIRMLESAEASLCFLALGAPKQEIFAARAAAHLPNMGFVSVGAGLDFLSGAQTRAPRLVRLLAAEWIWRLWQNPRQLAKRYASCLAILPNMTVRALRTRLAGQTGTHTG